MTNQPTHVNVGLEGSWVPCVTAQFLPGCRKCGSKHPLACKPLPADPDHCPGCGARVLKLDGPQVVPAEITGKTPTALIAKWCLSIGKFFRDLAQRL